MKKLTIVLKDLKGMTLVETMISIVIFLTVLAAIINVSLGSMSMGRRSEFAYTAYNLAKNHMETLRSMPYSTLANAAESDVYLDANGVSDPEGFFIRSTTTAPNFGGDTNLTQVTVSVDYIYRGTQTTTPTQLSAVIFEFA